MPESEWKLIQGPDLGPGGVSAVVGRDFDDQGRPRESKGVVVFLADLHEALTDAIINRADLGDQPPAEETPEPPPVPAQEPPADDNPPEAPTPNVPTDPAPEPDPEPTPGAGEE